MVTTDLPALHPGRSARMQAAQQAALRRAAAVCAVSEATARRVAAAGVEPARLHVTPNGLTPLPAGAARPVAGPFILLVGTLEPRKGHELLLRAVARTGHEELAIVFAGPPAGRSDTLRAVAGELGLADRLTVLGHVADDVLGALYRDAALVCLPSLGEGFGLPVLEALAAGAPVLASDLPAIREVAGESALLVPPGELDALAAGLRRLTADPELVARLRAAGPQRARAFSWEATAEATVRAYRSALGGRDRLDRLAPAGVGQ
jgi:glycosyltransferase involved in cell wall biosynthesis